MRLFLFILLIHPQISFASQPLISDFFSAPAFKNIILSPSGDKTLIKLKHKNNYLLMLYQFKSKQKDILFYEPKKATHDNKVTDNIISTTWLSNNEILILLLLDDGSYKDYLITISNDVKGKISTDFKPLSFSGYLVRPSKIHKRNIIISQRNSYNGTDLYYLNIDTGKKKGRLNGDLRQASHWLLDDKDRVNVAWGVIDGIYTIWYRNPINEEWEIIRSTQNAKEVFKPVWMKNKSILVLHNHDRNEIVLQEFDPIKKKLGKIIFEKKGIDLKGVIINSKYNAIASINYFQNGLLRKHYLAKETKLTSNLLKKTFPLEQAIVVSESSSEEQKIILTFNHENSGQYFHFDTKTNKMTFLGAKAPNLKSIIGKTSVIHHKVATSDGFEIESYLTLPNNIKNPPLIVMPHGGPIGVQDTIYFDPHSQLLASRGYATLKVNYRGSSGYGKKFMFAGKKQWGLNIENDINNALNNIINLNIIDKSRICIFGSSYGGYSALMSIIKYPHKFKCAISFAGVTDIPLMFAEDTRMKLDSYKKQMEEIVGDPIKDKEYQRNNSPVYRYKEILTPLLLIHGKKDNIVSSEHSERLALLLTKKHIPHELLLLNGVGHGFNSERSANIFYNKVFQFLDKNLAKNK